ncbi:pore-forming CpnT exporter EsxE [soil metagenome]
MADAFAVDPEGLADAVERMSTFQTALDGLLSEIDSVVRGLHEGWNGEAASAHTIAHQYWTQGAADMREALGRLHTAGGGAHGNYTGAISTNTNMWSS